MERKIIDMNIYKNPENITDLDLEIFQQILDENVSEAVLKSLGQFFALKMDDGDDYDSINEEMYDVTIPEDLEKTLKEINRKHYEESSINEDVNNITENAEFPENTELVVKENEVKEKCKTINLFNSEKNYRRAKQLSKTVALLLLIITLTFGTFAPQTQAMRFKLYNIFINENKGNADVVISKNTDSSGLYSGDNKPEEVVEEIPEVKLTDYFEEGEEIPYPSYLPEGVVLSDVIKDEVKLSLIFSHENIEIVRLVIYRDEMFKMNTDIDKSDSKMILINNQDAFITERNKYCILHWKYEDKIISLRVKKAEISFDTMIHIAECVKNLKI